MNRPKRLERFKRVWLLALPGALLVAAFGFVPAFAGAQAAQAPEATQAPQAAQAPEAPPVPLDKELALLPCFKCHNMKAFNSGVNGFPHKKHAAIDVHCNQCHDVHGHEATSINMQVCAGCHSGIQTVSYKAMGLTAEFSHERHLKKARCSNCHEAIFKMKTGANRITMDDMYQGRQCGACHNGKKAFSVHECDRCHNMKNFKQAVKFEGGGMGVVVFSHELHTGMYGCAECHEKLFKMKKSALKMDDMNKGASCGTCHNGKTAFPASDCARCHKQA